MDQSSFENNPFTSYLPSKPPFSHLAMEESSSYEEPLIKFVNQLLHHAEQEGASDLHLEPDDHATRIRYRRDGILYELTKIEPALATRVMLRLKVMAKLDISERRLPQDGRFQIQTKNHKIIDVRLSACPTLLGEKMVLRLLDNSKMALALDSLGFSESQKILFTQKISQPQGLILVTGPTGSGKTVTLYSALSYLNTKEKNILTVEDPVEIQLNGINQVQIYQKIGLDFATTLRAFLRQDPDIIMVGEIRDRETAEIAIQAAQTGHLVLSTLHTNSAAETLTRLLSMGIAPYHLAYALTLIVAQRLVRKLCPHCKQVEARPEPGTISKKSQKYFRANGCSLCHQGYSGRMGVFECLTMNEELAQLALSHSDTATFVKSAEASGFLTLSKAGMQKVVLGETSLAELNRVGLK